MKEICDAMTKGIHALGDRMTKRMQKVRTREIQASHVSTGSSSLSVAPVTRRAVVRAHAGRTGEIVVRANEMSEFVCLAAKARRMSAVRADHTRGGRDGRETFRATWSTCVVLHRSTLDAVKGASSAQKLALEIQQTTCTRLTKLMALETRKLVD